MDFDGDGIGDACDPDIDGDGVANGLDTCPNTPIGETVDANGCSDTQKDTDSDGVTDDIDTCPDTPNGETVDANGCSDSQKDTDGDGVTDDVDTCPDTPNGETVDANGCSDSQKDTDGDGVTDDVDTCPDTPDGATVDNQGCPIPLFIESSSFIDNVFPNPTSNNLKIILREGSKVKDLYFVDLFGKVNKPKSIGKTQESLEVNVSNLAEGVYVLEVVFDKEVKKVKVIIELSLIHI